MRNWQNNRRKRTWNSVGGAPEFLVNANTFVRWYNNTPLFVGSIIGVVVLALGVTGFIVFGKKKKEE